MGQAKRCHITWVGKRCCRGHSGDSWGRWDMNCPCETTFQSVIIVSWFVGECRCSQELRTEGVWRCGVCKQLSKSSAIMRECERV